MIHLSLPGMYSLKYWAIYLGDSQSPYVEKENATPEFLPLQVELNSISTQTNKTDHSFY